MAQNSPSKLYEIPKGTRIGHVHLKVADLERALGFYRDLLGFTITQRYGDQAAFLAQERRRESGHVYPAPAPAGPAPGTT